MSRSFAALVAVCALVAPCAADAQDANGTPGLADTARPAPAPASAPTAPSPAPASAPAPAPSWGLALDLGISSVYVFRGYNMFQQDSQWDQHPFAAPSITWSIPRVPGLSIGYWGAYQFAGANLRQAMDAGAGAESDLFVTYTRAVVGDLSMCLGFTAYLYPAAAASVAGTNVPTYLEPAIGASFSRVVDVGLKVSYYHGVQDAISAYRYTYFNPTVGKTLAVSKRVSVALAASFGYKLFNDRSTLIAEQNTLDTLVSAAVPIKLTERLSVKPAVSWAWTNLAGRSAADEMVVFASVNLGASF